MATSIKPLVSKHHAWSALALAVSLTGVGAVARADALSDLREQTEALQRKVNELENAQRKTAPDSAVTAGSTPGSFRLPDSSTSIKLGGYVKFDAVYSDITQGVDAVANQQTVDTAIPVGPAGAALKPADLFGEPAQAPSAERTITVTADTKWVNVNHYEVVRFVSNGREFTWYFDGVVQPRPFDLMQIAPAGFVDHGVTVYVAPSERDFPG